MNLSISKKPLTFATFILLVLLFLLSGILNQLDAQSISTQNIRGIIYDKISQTPLPGAVVALNISSQKTGTTTNANGEFALNNIPVGKVNIMVSYIGYKNKVLENLALNSGKELYLSIALEEEISQISEVIIKDEKSKNIPINSMSVISTRTFSVEETQKFAAAVNDPGRMASSFAGVVAAGDGNNHISIRGNSPNGLLWRMEGVEIPNPNHFSNVGTSGGGISILSAQLLSNSDFSTGAFAAEYGNALSGVFDLRLRKGNNQKTEYTFQAGVLGLDAAVEGPIKKGYSGSYLINYRYSTLSVLGKIGVPLGDAVTNFQDLSYHVNLPTKKAGTFALFGFLGLSNQDRAASKDSAMWKEDPYYQYQSTFYSNTGAFGFSNNYQVNNKGYLKTVLMFSTTQNGGTDEKIQEDYKTLVKERQQEFNNRKITLSSTYTHKINSKNFLRSGFVLNRLHFDLNQAQLIDSNAFWNTQIQNAGSTYSAQTYFQLNHSFNEKLSMNLGMHFIGLLLNNTATLEPRASIKYEANKKNVITFGYGLHSQIQPLGTYFVSNNNGELMNRNLGMSKSHHFVFGIDHNMEGNTHLKTELYYQFLYNIPISNNPNSTYSILNELEGYPTETLVNKGLGNNYGLELTLERFLTRNYYYLISASIFQSKYEAANNQWYNTRFNTNHALTITGGKEWNLKKKNRVLGFNIKTIWVGGFRNTPIDLEASIAQNKTIEKENEAFTIQSPDYFRFDFRLSIKRNYTKLTSTLALDIQNTTNRKNVGGQYFDSATGAIKYWYQTPLIPILSYRIEF